MAEDLTPGGGNAQPPRRRASKKTAAKKTAAKKTAAKKTAAKKKAAKKTAAKKATARKAPAKKAARKSAARPAGSAPPREAAVTEPPRAEERSADDADRPATPAVALPDPDAVERVWAASYPTGVPTTYQYPLVPLSRFLDDAAQDFPDSVAVEFLGYTMTYRQLLDHVDRLAAALAALGVARGDRVGLILPNCPQHVIAIFATLRLGAVVTENNPLYTEAELEYQLNDAGCKVVICLDPVYRKLAAVRSGLSTVEHYIATGVQDYLPFPKNWLFPLKGRRDGTYYRIPDSEGVRRFVDLIEATPPTVTQTEIDAREDVAMVLYTGGTTGVSKGVMLTHFNLVANAYQARLWLPDFQSGREKMLCVLPFFHSYGLTVCLTLGMLGAATLTLLPRFERDTVLKAIDKQKPTLFPGVPTMYIALNNARNVTRYDLSSIRACLSGAAPLPTEVARTFEAHTGGKLREGYGLTESSPLTHANPIYGMAKPGRIGLPITDTVCALVDLDDPARPAPPGGPGELIIHGPQVMRGYWQRPEETAAALRDGWLLTGDVARMDEEGYFEIVDRKKDLIISGGYNVYPRDVEEALYQHPKVEKAAVAGVPDQYRGETVKAYIVLKEGQAAGAADIDEFLRARLAAYKVPRHYEFRDALPETLVGKVLRRKLVEEERAKVGRSQAAGPHSR